MSATVQNSLADSLRLIYRQLDLFHDELLQLAPKELAFLLILEEVGECRVKDLAGRVNLPLSTVSWTADRMVTNGFISRKPDATDRRAIILSLDKRGLKAIKKHKEIFDNVSKIVVENLPESEAKRVALLIAEVATFFQRK